jgi:hypothetical protein
VTLPGVFEKGGEYRILLNFGNRYEFIGGSSALRLLPPTE